MAVEHANLWIATKPGAAQAGQLALTLNLYPLQP